LKVNSRIRLSRRDFLTAATSVALTVAAPGAFALVAPVRDRALSFYNTHTGEKLSATFWSGGNYLDDGIEEISWVLRDHRAGTAHPVDTRLLDLLFQLQAKVERPGEFQVISGYRSPETNKMLNQKSSKVARRSYHMLGKAIDVRMPGFDTRQLSKAAISLKSGGVGYYANSDFIHLDVGPVRKW
jgi:uncharacterized protein YcbK (DUF882 family)